jgi:hypothetical protein
LPFVYENVLTTLWWLAWTTADSKQKGLYTNILSRRYIMATQFPFISKRTFTCAHRQTKLHATSMKDIEGGGGGGKGGGLKWRPILYLQTFCAAQEYG